MVGHLFHGFGSDCGDLPIRRTAERPPRLELIRREEQLPSHGHGEVTVLLLDQQAVDEVALVALERVGVLAAPGAVELRSSCVQRTGLAEEIERDIRQRDILFEQWRPRRPLRQAV